MTYALSNLHPEARQSNSCCATCPLLVIDLIISCVMIGVGLSVLRSGAFAISHQAALALLLSGGAILLVDTAILVVKRGLAKSDNDHCCAT